MAKTETNTLPPSFIQSHLNTIFSLLMFLNKSNLPNAVKEHNKMGLKVIAIIYDDLNYNTGTKPLSGKEFDTFFKSFPTLYFNHRELIPVDMLFKSMQLSIKTNSVENVS